MEHDAAVGADPTSAKAAKPITPPLIWGYRNVWFNFKPSDATLFIPVEEKNLDLMHDTFMACFTTQKAASFPSPHYGTPFVLHCNNNLTVELSERK